MLIIPDINTSEYTLANKYVAVHTADINSINYALAFLALPEEKKIKSQSISSEENRQIFVKGNGFIYSMLSKITGVSANDLPIVYGEYGKPAFSISNFPSFSISHSHNFWTLAIIDAGFIGVDIEKRRFIPEAKEIAQLYFPAEAQALDRLPLAEKNDAFLRCWTRKEAVIKALGLSVADALSGFKVDIKDTYNPMVAQPLVEKFKCYKCEIAPIKYNEHFIGAISLAISVTR